MQQSKLHLRAALAGSLLLAGALVALPAMAKSQTQHLRGTISSVTDNGFKLQTENGGTRMVKISSDTKIIGTVSSSLDQIDENTFIGTANVKRNGQWQALEVVVFPESMKGSGLGDYPWDLSPSQVRGGSAGGQSMASGGSSMTNGTVTSGGSSMTNGTVTGGGSSMTNGTVTSGGSSMTNGTVTGGGSSMTNGTVKQSSNGAGMTVKVDYGKGSKTIHIPQDVPVVALQKGSKSDLKSGAAVFVAGPKGTNPFQAKRVIVGINGTKPPM